MSQSIYRPLLKLSKHPENVYLPLEPNYSIAEIATIKKYLPKIYTFSGVDATSYQEEDKSAFERQKLKLKAINGKSIVDDQPLKFYRVQDIEAVEWRDTYLCLDVPFNLKQDQQSAKEELQMALQNYLKTKIVVKNKKTNQIYDSNSQDISSIRELEVYFIPSDIEPQAFDKQYREIRVRLPLVLIVAKKDRYDLNTLREVLTDDILHSLKIMIKNQMSIRVIRGGHGLFLHSFVRDESEEAEQGLKLVALIEKKAELKEQKSVESTEPNDQMGSRQDPSNRTLLMVLIGLAVIYIYLKLNPLQKSLNEL